MEYREFFIKLVGIVLGILLITIGVSEVMLYRLNETKMGTELAYKEYMAERVLYGSAVANDIAFLKIPAIREKEPQLIALGASRVMQFRQKFFNVSFYTTGGLVDSIGGMAEVYHECIRDGYRPKYVIVDVDWDWLNPNYPHPEGMANQDFYHNDYLPARRMMLYKRLFQELIKNDESSEKLRQALISGVKNKTDIYGNRAAIGAMAAFENSGYRSKDGSYQYGTMIKPKARDELLENTRQRIRGGYGRFDPANDIDYVEFSKLCALIAEIKSNGAVPIVFLPPFAHECYEMMLGDARHSSFIQAFQTKIKELAAEQEVAFFDFSDIEGLDGATDDEALDGFHGSERTYGRICLALAKNPELAPLINTDYIKDRLQDSPYRMYIVPLEED